MAMDFLQQESVKNYVNFNLIPWDSESYLVAADYAEEQGFLLSNAIRKKILPLDIEGGYGYGFDDVMYFLPNIGIGDGSGYAAGWIGTIDCRGDGSGNDLSIDELQIYSGEGEGSINGFG